MAGLSGFEKLYPHQLSGGMRQRVALLMTLACDPNVLLLDEPFGALDTHTKIVLHKELLEIWRQLKQTIVMVTHDLDEAITLSDRVIVLSVAAKPSGARPPRRRSRIRATCSRCARQEVSPATSSAVWHVLGEEFRRNQAFDRVATGNAA